MEGAWLKSSFREKRVYMFFETSCFKRFVNNRFIFFDSCSMFEGKPTLKNPVLLLPSFPFMKKNYSIEKYCEFLGFIADNIKYPLALMPLANLGFSLAHQVGSAGGGMLRLDHSESRHMGFASA